MKALFEILQKIPWFIWLLALMFLLRKIKVRRPRRDTDFQETETRIDGSEDEETEPEEPSSAEDKGRRGEDLIAEILRDSVTGEFELLRNVYIPNGDTTSEVDLVMVHERGIAVFESKNYGGLIFGSKDGLNWVQRFPNGERHSFYNPIRQNESHIKALSRYLYIPRLYFCSYVVFSDRCRLENVPESDCVSVITRTSELEEDLERFFYKWPSRFRGKRIAEITEKLRPLTNVGREIKEKHVADIRKAQNSAICPFCGGRLVKRRGKYGEFWGCLSYPKCKFKRKMEE